MTAEPQGQTSVSNSNTSSSDDKPDPAQPHHDESVEQDGSDNKNIDFDFVLAKCELPPPAEFGPVEAFVSKAVQSQEDQGESGPPTKQYKALLDALRKKNDLALLKKILLAFRTSPNTVQHLTSTSRTHARLVHQIVRFNPFCSSSETEIRRIGRTVVEKEEDVWDYSLVDAHFQLLVVLVSANSTLLVPTLTALWKCLLDRMTKHIWERQQRIHAALATIARICPTAKVELFPIIQANAPFPRIPENRIRFYYSQCLLVLNYMPSLEGEILSLLISKSLEMDVAIKVDEGGEATIDQDQEEGIFTLDLSEEQKPKVSEEENPKAKTDVSVDNMADRLDSLMFLLFKYIEDRVTKAPSSAYQLFYILQKSFESSVLITHKSKFVQFVILHLCGLETKLAKNEEDTTFLYREFAAKLIEVILDPYRAVAIRQIAACYVASFISRATYICAETVCEAISALLRWAEAYTETLGKHAIFAADMREQCSLHSLFYTVCQSAFYIMCFRGVEAIDFYRKATSGDKPYEEPSRIDISAARWTKLCKHPLQPLRYCLESVRSEFLIVSKSYELISEEVLDQLVADEKRMASNAGRQRKRARSVISTPATLEKERQSGGVGGMGHGSNPLESFFPFDPYLLQRSSKYIEDYYGHWEEPLPASVSDGEDMDMQTEHDGEAGTVSEDDDQLEDDDDDDMSVESGTSIASEKSHEAQVAKSSSFEAERQSMHNAWTNTLKRSRAASIENGSW